MDVKIPGETILGYLSVQNSTQKWTASITETASTAGLVSGPSGILYRPSVANPYGMQLPAENPDVHNINWGGYNSPQATPQPTQIVAGDTVVTGTDEGVYILRSASTHPNPQVSATTTASNSTVKTTALQTVDTTA